MHVKRLSQILNRTYTYPIYISSQKRKLTKLRNFPYFTSGFSIKSKLNLRVLSTSTTGKIFLFY